MADDQRIIRVVIADDSDDARLSVHKLLSLEEAIAVVGEARDGNEAIARARELRPDVLLMDMHMPNLDGVAATETIVAEVPGVEVILISVVDSPETLRAAMLAGARDYLVNPFTPEDLAASIRRAYELRGPQAPLGLAVEGPSGSEGCDGNGAGCLIAVCGPKGGIGRTTVACNLAVALAKNHGRKVALLDGCFNFGDVGTAMNLRSSLGMGDLSSAQPDEIDLRMVEEVLVAHSSGVKVLQGAARPGKDDGVGEATLRKIVGELTSAYEYVIADLSPSLQDSDLALIDVATKAILLYSPEMAAIKDLKLFLELSQGLGYPRTKFLPVANRMGAPGGVRVQDVQANLNIETVLCIPDNPRVANFALNKGVPFVLANRDSAIAKSLVELSDLLQRQAVPSQPKATETAKKKSRGWLSFGRKKSASAA
ncbi:MAG: response regulator [Chloroflexota bacterium]